MPADPRLRVCGEKNFFLNHRLLREAEGELWNTI
jgi:hypothetical protein